MLDRASTFADPEIIAVLKTDFIPVAIDQAYQRRQKDSEGEFYRKIAGQGPRRNFDDTTQGLYVAGPDGALLGFTNNRGSDRVKQLLKKGLEKYQPSEVVPIDPGTLDVRYNPQLPEGGLVIRVQAKVMGGYKKTDDKWEGIFQTSVSRDNLWITGEEHEALVKGTFPKSLQERIARFHLVDNTRGEPPMWSGDEIRHLNIALKDGAIDGTVALRTASQDRGYDAHLRGKIEVKDGRVSQFEMVSEGEFWGHGPYTRNPPPGKFPLAISFTLADGTDVADAIPPQASRGWVQGYLKPD
ncbi:MAG: hypothetical protein ABI680_18510 [Chthoniobacteraceae bacterium]